MHRCDRTVIIAGGRNFDNYELLKESCNEILNQFTDIEIVSGGAKGTDSLGQKYAAEYGYSVKVFKANWALYGRGAGPRRNEEMAKYADYIIAFWDGESSRTKNMLKLARKYGLQSKVVHI